LKIFYFYFCLCISLCSSFIFYFVLYNTFRKALSTLIPSSFLVQFLSQFTFFFVWCLCCYEWGKTRHKKLSHDFFNNMWYLLLFILDFMLLITNINLMKGDAREVRPHANQLTDFTVLCLTILYVSWALSLIASFTVFTDTYRIYSVHI